MWMWMWMSMSIPAKLIWFMQFIHLWKPIKFTLLTSQGPKWTTMAKTFPYELMEELKNGELLNTKYNSEVFRFPVPHVVSFSNETPNMTMLSADRYKIINTE